MQDTRPAWQKAQAQPALCHVPRDFAQSCVSPHLLPYLTAVLQLCPRGGKTCEVQTGSGYGAIWLSLRGAGAEGLDASPPMVERARQVNNVLGGGASFRVGEALRFWEEGRPHFQVVHHQGLLEHYFVPQIRAILAQQAASAHWVVFSVPSVHYPFDAELTDERLLPLDEWRRILEPFDLAELRLYGDPKLGGQEHVLCVLRGQPADRRLHSLMAVPAEPYPDGISAIVHTRNEAHQIADCLETLKGWTDEIVVCDMESTDATVEIARRCTDNILLHPPISNFDRSRNVSALRAGCRWVFYLDADERVPPGLGAAVRQLIASRGDTFEAVIFPFRHHFAGQWLQCLYPGYTAPRLFRNGRFFFNPRLHAGAQVDGRVAVFPADNPELAVVHYSFNSLGHYLEKLNRYTDGEAANMERDGQPFHWQSAIRHFVDDFRSYYDGRAAGRDGVHGFLYSFLSAFYRFEQHAKLYERRYHSRQLQPPETVVPASVEQVLEYALAVARDRPRPAPTEIRVEDGPGAASVVWSGPLLDPSGYGDENRNLVLAAEEAGVAVAAHVTPWSRDEVPISPLEQTRLGDLAARPAAPGFVQILHNFPRNFHRHPQAGVAIGRTMFETDRAPQEWVKGCNRMDFVWVPTEFNRRTFTDAGVAPEKLVVIPGAIDPDPYRQPTRRHPAVDALSADGRFTFLTLFDWTLRKGWDVLLRAFIEAFEGIEDVRLVLKVWSTMGYPSEEIPLQAAAFVRSETGHDILADGRIRFLTERLDTEGMIALYQAANAFVLPSRGEGWGRPYMEAMACGIPAIGTNWSGNTAFMTAENSYLLDCTVVPVPELGWREIPTYRGHRWAEPDREHLKQLLRRVYEERGEAAETGRRAQEEIAARFNRPAVGRIIAAEIERALELSEGAGERGSGGTGVVQGAECKVGNAKHRDPVTPSPAHPVTPSLVRVRWEGAQFVWHSLAYVNRELCLGLLGVRDTHCETPSEPAASPALPLSHSPTSPLAVELSVVSSEPFHFPPDEDPRFPKLAERCFAPLSGPAHVHVRHFFPPRFDPPEEGQFVLIQPWEYGYLPAQWVEPIREHVREVWCYSRYVRHVYLASGIPEERLHVVPLGVDPAIFRPDAPPYIFTTEAGAHRVNGSTGQWANGETRQRADDTTAHHPFTPSSPHPFTFLFAGGTLHRKGIDILLEAYLKAFSAYDDVCLVVKDTGTQTVYRGQNERERIIALAGDPTRPPIVYLDDDLSPHQLAGIYTASDCLVQPYRGEGFCLPALEAMACGRPVIVPAGGPTDDFVDESVGWRVPAEKRPFGNGRIGEWECVGPTWMLEVAPEELARAMRHAYANRDEVSRRGAAAAHRVREAWTWEHSCAAVLKRLAALREQASAKCKVQSGGQQGSHAPTRPHSHTPTLPHGHTPTRPHSHTSTRAHPTISLCMIV